MSNTSPGVTAERPDGCFESSGEAMTRSEYVISKLCFSCGALAIESNWNNRSRVRADGVQRVGTFATGEKYFQADRLCNQLDKKEGRKRERGKERSRTEDGREKKCSF